MPGGQFTNLKEQADAMGLGPKWGHIARAYAEVNMAFGDIVKVTPSSKVVGDMAIFLVSHGLTIQDIERLPVDHTLTLPNSVIDMFEGSLGEPPGGWPKKLANIILKGGTPRRGRPGARLAPVRLPETASALEKKLGRKPSRTDVLSYLMYPDVFLKFARAHAAYGELEALPTPQFFYGMTRGEEITVSIEDGKSLIIKYLTTSDPHPDGTKTVFFELNGQPREITVRDKSLQPTVAARLKADPAVAGQVGAPIPGAISSVAVELGQKVEKGERLLVLEAMKMQTTVYAPIAGSVKQKLVATGSQVESKDLLLIIE
jgi:pyruvate carboxylase